MRNGYLPERTIQTGVGDVAVTVPKVRDRNGSGVKFNSRLLPPYLKRTSSVEEVLPWLYLKGVSTGDFSEALSALPGPEARGLSPATISRLKAKWIEEHQDWQKRSLRHRRYVYIWADGIYFNLPMLGDSGSIRSDRLPPAEPALGWLQRVYSLSDRFKQSSLHRLCQSFGFSQLPQLINLQQGQQFVSFRLA
ncbi:Transposase for insertion sequence element IS6120 [Halomicronema hongdechloris C2206]|uniref:Mutator family transposase n=1 Tax=Halomicronema hongdechloris C2206 TaxID=1641165 RepID=A0A1Z3HSJ0_9CYAN|nr:Transposase for insertion sequence element IS6120 [Halomicronema hongdechloris C2206]